jgi:hypothetical protein
MKLVATRDGFYGGTRIRRGAEFDFYGEKQPKWAKPAAEAKAFIAAEDAKSVVVDTKPQAAAAAARKRAMAD